jgi:hypothetical protein
MLSRSLPSHASFSGTLIGLTDLHCNRHMQGHSVPVGMSLLEGALGIALRAALFAGICDGRGRECQAQPACLPAGPCRAHSWLGGSIILAQPYFTSPF